MRLIREDQISRGEDEPRTVWGKAGWASLRRLRLNVQPWDIGRLARLCVAPIFGLVGAWAFTVGGWVSCGQPVGRSLWAQLVGSVLGPLNFVDPPRPDACQRVVQTRSSGTFLPSYPPTLHCLSGLSKKKKRSRNKHWFSSTLPSWAHHTHTANNTIAMRDLVV